MAFHELNIPGAEPVITDDEGRGRINGRQDRFARIRTYKWKTEAPGEYVPANEIDINPDAIATITQTG
jgi:hypothetical protein